GLRDAEPQQVETLEEEFPDPFAEKTTAPVAAQEQEAEVEPQPLEDIEEAIVEAEAIEDEEFAVFAEITPAPAEPPPVVETPAPVMESPSPVVETPAPVTESPAAAEPVAQPETAQECVANATGLNEKRFLIDLNRCTCEDL